MEDSVMECTAYQSRFSWIRRQFNRFMELFRKKPESNYIAHAKRELQALGYDLDDKEEGPNKWIMENLFELLEVFGKQGHSGSSAPYCVGMFEKLAMFKPLGPITCTDAEWSEDTFGGDTYQNKRISSVFKEGKDGKPYYLEAIVFRSDKGWTFTGTADGIKSRQFIKLPFTPKTFYVDVIEHEVAPDDWEYTIKDRSQLVPVFEYYEPMAEMVNCDL